MIKIGAFWSNTVKSVLYYYHSINITEDRASAPLSPFANKKVAFFNTIL